MVIAGLLAAITGPVFGRKSPAGVAMKKRIEVLKERLQGQAKIDYDPEFAAVLPWAVALGVEESAIRYYQGRGDLHSPYYRHHHLVTTT